MKPHISKDAIHRAPPVRVMEDHKRKDAVHSTRRLETEIERVANAKFELAKQTAAETSTKAFEEEDRRRRQVPVDPKAVATLGRLGLPSPEVVSDTARNTTEWKSPFHARGPDALERRSFMKAIGLTETRALSPPVIDRNERLSFEDASPSSCSKRRLPHDASAAQTPPPRHLVQHSVGHSSAPTSPKLGGTKAATIDNSRAPSRTMVGHLKTIRTVMATRPLAPLPQRPSLVDTRVPDRGSDVVAESMLGKFKLLQAEERDFITDVGSRKIAEEQEGTLLHFEMTQSIRRVEEIVAALERGKEFRDMAAYKHAREEVARNESINQSAHEEASLEELRQVIQILLKDSSRQATIHQKLELESRRTTQELRDAQELLVARNGEINEIKQQLDDLVRGRETLKKENARLEQQLEMMMSHSRRDILGSADADEVFSRDVSPISPTQGHLKTRAQSPKGRSQNSSESVVRRPLDGATFLRELNAGSMIPRLETVPNGDDVTIVCTAVQSISQLWEQCGQDMPTAISLHNRILLDEIPKHKGYQVKTAGEEFMVAFHTTTAAINFAMTVQEQLALQVWPQKLAEQPYCAVVRREQPLDAPENVPVGDLWRGLRVAMGIHFGSVHVEINPITNGYDYMGQTVNRALMLKRVCHGGMAAVSKEVYERLNQELLYLDSEDISPTKKPRSSGISYAETLRRKTSLKDLTVSMRRQPTSPLEETPPLCPITMAFHCKIPAARTSAQDVYCVLPMSLEDRLADIQAANKQMAAKHGIDFEDVLQATQEDEQPSELENILGTFSRHQGKKALFLTADGVEDASVMKSDEEIEAIAIQQAGLPSGQVALLSIQCESVRNKRFLEKILAKDMELLIQKFRDSVELATAPFGGKFVDSRGDIQTIAFPSVGIAVRCALAIDAELTMTEWPKWIDNYKDTEQIRWYKNTLLFAGLRPSMGVHVAQLEPHYDPMTRHVSYVGADAYVSFRLSCLARPGQTILEETVAYQALGAIRPLPLFTHVVPNASNSSVAARLCIVMSRCFVGRHFYWGGIETYAHCKNSQYKSQYKRMRMSLEMEDVRWRRDATRVVAKEHVSGGITAPMGNSRQGGAKKPQEDEEGGGDEEGAGAGALLGLGDKFEAVVQKADGTITAAMEVRQRDMEVINIFCTTLLDKLNSDNLPETLRDREPIINQLEKLEHNLMVMHDVFYEGQLVAFQPFIADISEIRELPLKGTSRDNAIESAPGASGRKSAGNDEWATDVDDDDENGAAVDDDDDTTAAIAATQESAGLFGRLPTESSGRGSATEDELRRRLLVLEEEVLLAHKILRSMLDVLKDWMEPLLGTHIRYVMPDDEVVSKLIAVDRGAREPYLKQQAAAAAAAATQGGGLPTAAGGTAPNAPGGAAVPPGSGSLGKAIPKTTRQMWRQIVEHAVTDVGLEERLRGKGSKLLRSMESLVCRHFLFLRQYVKRMRIKERGTGK